MVVRFESVLDKERLIILVGEFRTVVIIAVSAWCVGVTDVKP